EHIGRAAGNGYLRGWPDAGHRSRQSDLGADGGATDEAAPADARGSAEQAGISGGPDPERGSEPCRDGTVFQLRSSCKRSTDVRRRISLIRGWEQWESGRIGIKSRLLFSVGLTLSLAACQRQPRTRIVKTLEEAGAGDLRIAIVGSLVQWLAKYPAAA